MTICAIKFKSLVGESVLIIFLYFWVVLLLSHYYGAGDFVLIYHVSPTLGVIGLKYLDSIQKRGELQNKNDVHQLTRELTYSPKNKKEN